MRNLMKHMMLLNRHGGEPAWTPAQLSGILFWREVRLGTVFEDSDGTTPATDDGDPVGRYVDQASGPTSTQATTGAKPTLKLNIVNGQPTLRFDGGDSLDYNVVTAAGSFTFLAVVASANKATGGVYNFFAGNQSTAGNNAKIGVYNSLLQVRVINNGTLGAMAWSPDNNTHALLTVQRDANNKVDAAFNNASFTRLHSDAAQAGNFTLSRTGASETNGQGFIGDVAFMLLAAPAISVDDLALLKAYINARYALWT